MYDIAYSSRTPLEVKLKALSEIAQGAKLLLIYDYEQKYTSAGGEDDSLRVRPSRPWQDVVSAHQGALHAEHLADGTLVVQLPLETTDFVFGKWQ